MIHYLFLLGGNDLEMNEIKKILKNFKNDNIDIEIFDKNLKWGAKLSAYKSEIEKFKYKYEKIFGIELIEDITPPDNYTAIDHHNEKEDNPSSLEQIAEILEINLTREQKLIAANDKGYIPAMENLCATEEEIQRIRKLDKQMQGVTDEDEALAEKSINLLIIENGIYIVKSLTDKFSTITDKLYGKTNKLIIYNDKTLIYYGDGRNILKDHFSNLVNQKKAFFGGGFKGFFGFAENVFDSAEIFSKIDEIKEILKQSESNIVSTHIFLFPFSFTQNDNSNTPQFELLQQRLSQDNNWEKQNFTFENSADYNEYIYFYNFVREALYPINTNNSRTNVSELYRYNIGTNAHYEIYTSNHEAFILDIEKIELHIFSSDVAVLAFHLTYKADDLDDETLFEKVLAINQFGRRLYPQYLEQENDSVILPIKTILPCKLLIRLGETVIEDNFSFYLDKDFNKLFNDLNKAPINSKIINHFLPKNITINPLIDDRMFVISWHKNQKISNELKSLDPNNNYNYLTNHKWYAYIFVDDNPTYIYCKNTNMLKKLIEAHTYERFTDHGTFYGISRYSFVCLTKSNSFSEILRTHVKTIYYKMVLLSLVQRASILKFSKDVTRISENINQSGVLDEIEELTAEYLKFVNSLYFREVTAQEQGIELYDKIQETLRIERDIKDLNREIDELYQHAKFKDDREQTTLMNNLGILGAVLLIPTLITSYLGMNIFDANKLQPFNYYYFFIFIALLGIISWFSYLHFRKNFSPKYQKNKLFNINNNSSSKFSFPYITIIIILTFAIMFLAIIFFKGRC